MNFLRHIQWRPGIGDPTFMGWLTVAAYATAAVAAFFAVRTASASGTPQDATARRRIWIAVGILLALLCVNKQLDLQSLLTDLGRAFAKEQGWYENRRGFQKLFVAGLLLGSAALVGWTVWRCRDFWRTHALLSAGLAFLLTFIVVRAVSFHHVDMFLGTRIAGLRMNWILELTGIGLVGAAALREIAYQTSERA